MSPSASRRLGALLALTACGTGHPPSVGLVGERAPSYAAVTTGGDSVSLASFAGHAVLLNVWATWCVPCREEMPGLVALHRAWESQGLTVLATSIDSRAADREVERFVRDFDVAFTVLRDPTDRVSRTFGLIGVPNTVLIDRRGIVVHRWIGQFDPMAEDAQAAIRRALTDSTPAVAVRE